MRALLIALAISLAAPAIAAPEVTPQARAKARAHIKKARALYDQEQFDQAVAEYEAAYQLAGVTDILYNIGQILRTKGDKPAAVKAYRRYLEADPSGAHAEDARDYAAQLTKDQVPITSRDKWDFVEAQKKPPALAERWQKLLERVGVGDLSGLDAELSAMQAELNKPATPVVDFTTSGRQAAETTVVKKERAPMKPLPPYARKWWFWTAIGGGAVVIVAVIVGAVLGQPGDPTPSLGVLR